ncbi:MAG: DUF4352 domain-containing protein [Alphaproteobacteria bacterium]|nr:DUF4352 domain-containing protein [Alphaproteobacteria bacterium]
MRTWLTAAALVLGGISTLACGGVGGGGSAAAQALCGHLEKELECPCVSIGAGSAVSIDGLEVKVDKVVEWTGKDSLPEIQNSDERAKMKEVGNHALVLEISITNTEPVKSGVDPVFYLMTGDGDKAFNQPYNSKVYLDGREGWIDFWNDDKLGPNKTRQAVLVFAVPKSGVEGSLLVLRKNEKRPDPMDPRGRMKTFTEELAVLDLGPPT